MKTLKHLFMLGLFCMISIGASAEVYSGWCGGNAKWSFDTSTGLLSITGSGKMTDYYSSSYVPWYDYRKVIISLSIGDQITSIGEWTFCHCLGLTSVTIPNSVTEIGNFAFYDCSGLTSVTIPNSVTSIGNDAFYGCSGLISVTIGNSVTSIGSSAFTNCNNVKELIYAEGTKTVLQTSLTSITSVTIPNSVTEIGKSAFYSCKALTSVTIPNSVTSIASSAFYGCSGLTSMVVESGNKVYDSRDNCNAIIETASNTLITGCMNTTIPNSVTEIGEYAFFNCSGLTSVTIPNSVTEIGSSAFRGCKGLTSVTIPNSVTSIGNYAFSDCSGLTSVTIGNSVTSIGSEAFSGCIGLTSVTIGNSVTEIEKYAFYGCSGLTSVNITDLDKWAEIEFKDYNANPLYYAHNLYLNGQLVKDAKLTTAKKIGNYAFYGCSGLTSIDIPNSVIEIGIYAFSGCKSLPSVTIPNSVTLIEGYAFYNCTGLTSVKVYRKRPLSINASVWDGVYKHKCTLYVPEGTWTTYCYAPVWEDFVNIEEFSDEPGEDVYLTIMGVCGVILQQAVEMGETYKYLLDNKKNGKIIAVTFNGEDVTADVTDGKYTTPKITGNSEIYVEYDNQPLGDTNLDGMVNVNDITKTAEIILLRAKAEMEAKAAIEAVSEP